MKEYEITSKLRGIERGWIIVDGKKKDGKKCNTCGIMKIMEDYTPNKTAYDGKFNKCKKCCAKRQREYTKERPDIRRKAERKWREKNPGKVKEMSRRSRKKHAEGYARRLKEFHERNPEAKKVYHANRRARLKELPNNFTSEWADLLLDIYGGCIVTGKTEDIHWDHFIPISTGKGGTTFGNMIPLHSEVNMRKSANNPIEFLIQEGFTDKQLYGILFCLSKLNGMNVDEYTEYVYKCFEDGEVS